ncbi:MAG: ROK family protein [Phycisphaerales bacterium]|nr:ROK family protein [Phycisphaerales bacterium]
MYLHPSQLRVANTRLIFRVLLARGGCSRAELARRTGLSPVTTGKVVDELLAAGLAAEAEPGRTPDAPASPMGRPPRIVSLNPDRSIPILELGVRESLLYAVDLAGAPAAPVERFKTPATQAAFVRLLRSRARRIGISEPPAAMVSVPGVLDASAERILFSPNLPWTQGRGLLTAIRGLWKAPTGAVQEIQALALGHQAAGDAPESFVLVDFGDGVGGAVITGGHLLQGPLPLCGEIGHTGVQGNRRPCACGSTGCLETLVSRAGLLQSYRAARRRPRAAWAELRAHVAECRSPEPWLLRSIDSAAVVIAGAINLLGIQHIVLTGDLPSLHPAVVGEFGERISQHALIARFAKLDCRAAGRRRALGLIAAAADRILLPEPETVGAARLPSAG